MASPPPSRARSVNFAELLPGAQEEIGIAAVRVRRPPERGGVLRRSSGSRTRPERVRPRRRTVVAWHRESTACARAREVARALCTAGIRFAVSVRPLLDALGRARRKKRRRAGLECRREDVCCQWRYTLLEMRAVRAPRVFTSYFCSCFPCCCSVRT